MFAPKIIALDLDGTLFSRSGEVTPYTREQIRLAVRQGVVIVISSGRPFAGLPVDVAKELGIEYAITANGAGIYRIEDRACLREDCLSPKDAAGLCKSLGRYRLHLDAFIGGDAFTEDATFDIVRNSPVLPESAKQYILTSRNCVPDLPAYILKNNLSMQKAALTFEREADGTFLDRDAARAYLESCPEVSVVCGGYFNLEFTRAGVTKGTGLSFLCDCLGIPIEASAACGDSENDLSILKTAGFSVAMENADDEVKAVCDCVTSSCDDDGVGKIIAQFLHR